MLEIRSQPDFDSVCQLAVGISEHAQRVARHGIAKTEVDVAWQCDILSFGYEGWNSGKCTPCSH